MNIETLNQLREMLIKNSIPVSDPEYTENNYDDTGNLIEGSIPTITTEFCEVGVQDDGVYLVFIIESGSFDRNMFERIKRFPNVQMYGFVDFKKTLYPADDFDYDDFIVSVKQDRFLQIQFDYRNITAIGLFSEYRQLERVFSENGFGVMNQLGKI